MQIISVIVKALAAMYIMYRLWYFLYNEKSNIIWRFFTPKKVAEKPKAELKPLPVKKNDESVVGKTHTVYLQEPVKEKDTEPEPTISIKLETDEIAIEKDINEEDFEYNLNEPVLREEDLSMPFEDDLEYNNSEFSTGMTFAEISKAVEAVQNIETGDDNTKSETARILYEVRNTDMFTFFTSQIANTETVENLFSQYLDGDGMLKPQKTNSFSTEGFNMEEFV